MQIMMCMGCGSLDRIMPMSVRYTREVVAIGAMLGIVLLSIVYSTGADIMCSLLVERLLSL